MVEGEIPAPLEPESMAKGRNPDRKYTGPPGHWGFSVGLTTPPRKSTTVKETQMKHQTYTSCLVGGGLLESAWSRQSQQHRIPTWSIFLSPKQRTVIAVRNVRTMYEKGKASMVAMEVRRHNISLLGIAEKSWQAENRHGSATHLGDQITTLLDKLFFGAHREVDGEGDRATAGGETQTTSSSREVFPGISWNACPGTEGTGGTLSVAYMFRDGIIEGFRSDQKRWCGILWR